MKTHISVLAVIATVTICLASTPALAASGQTIQVSGSMQERVLQFAVTSHGVTVTAVSTLTGTLAGDGIVHIFSSDIIDLQAGIEENVISARIIFTSDGKLFLSEIGSRNRDSVSVVSTVVRGTGKFKNATGQLLLQGLHTGTGPIEYTYSGTIKLAQ